ncbi:HAMP domain-containing sensor histidine kinase [Cohnella nanjingensis]|uniref:histidine kinase n=1 Tax=Cohnella nanjingensis TaxID=1387779 RepID=A0A7X0RL27_9BACL|nr:HAMP domain-containing sensor histidine kinase [Cohnella nanjingensis]MBB6669494.1 two-component sensor histidine kinase [Cohnella nanjingensis]
MNKLVSRFRWELKLLALIVCWMLSLSIAYVGVSAAFRRWLPETSGYWFNIAVGMAGSVIFCFGAALIGHMLNPRSFPLIDEVNGAMRRIAKGDFDVSLDHVGKDELFAELADSVSAMALDLKRMERLRQQFVSDVSHEIQSPLTSIGGFAQVLRSGSVDERTRDRYLAIIETESKRLSALGDNLLKLTSLDSELHPFAPVPYRLDRQLRAAAVSLEPQWLEKGLSLRADLPEMTVMADEDLMLQVWINLLANSIKFTSAGGEIELGAVREGGEWRVRVRDSGSGIAEDDLPRIFERFFKADRSRNRAQEGSGLGLSIAKRIVERHHGRIEAESVAGEGTAMTVVLQANC